MKVHQQFRGQRDRAGPRHPWKSRSGCVAGGLTSSLDQGYLVVLSSGLYSKPWEPLSSYVLCLSLGSLVQGFSALISFVISGKGIDTGKKARRILGLWGYHSSHGFLLDSSGVPAMEACKDSADPCSMSYL